MQSMLWQLDLTWHTLVDWENFIRDVCSEDVRRHPIQLGGLDANGDPIIVEIDESKFFNRKYNRGQWREGHWVFGAIERATGHCIVQVVQDRTAATLLAMVQQWMLAGTHVRRLGGVRRRQSHRRRNLSARRGDPRELCASCASRHPHTERGLHMDASESASGRLALHGTSSPPTCASSCGCSIMRGRARTSTATRTRAATETSILSWRHLLMNYEDSHRDKYIVLEASLD